jgi:L-lactate utilization protein LutC
MNNREKILKGLGRVKVKKNEISLPLIKDREIFTGLIQSKNELVNRFSKKIIELKGEISKVSNISQAALKLKSVLRGFPEKSVLMQSASLIDRVLEEQRNILKYIDQKAQLSMSSISFAEYQAGITSADYLVARTGSIVLNAKTAGGRRLSVLPPVHIVLAKTDQLVPSLDTVLHKLTEENLNVSFLTIITGPSRTSDIEKQLVLGAHGPKRLIIILIDI